MNAAEIGGVIAVMSEKMIAVKSEEVRAVGKDVGHRCERGSGWNRVRK